MEVVEMKRIDSFRNEYFFLSNFFPCKIQIKGLTFLTLEHAFQAAKCALWEDKVAISMLPKPGEAKRFARAVRMRDDWNEIKLGVMESLLRAKFSRPDLKAKLLATGDAQIVEGNTWNDRFWGVCNGVGANHLGRLLMELRDKLAV